MTVKTPRKTSPLPAVIAMGVLVVLAIVFISELGAVSGGGDGSPAAESTLTADTYAPEVAALLATGDASVGEALITRYGCVACHAGAGAEHKLAPVFEGVGSRAETRRPPLSAAAYLYESIVHPTAFELEGYSGNMPVIYDTQIPDEDLGSIIAYLLTLTGE
jgi:mono/diheme cytochrome c family protein